MKQKTRSSFAATPTTSPRARPTVSLRRADAVAARGRLRSRSRAARRPKTMYALLAEAPAERTGFRGRKHSSFSATNAFVPPGDERSNAGMARRALLDKVPLPPRRFFAVDTTGAPNAEAAARAYEDALAASSVFLLTARRRPFSTSFCLVWATTATPPRCSPASPRSTRDRWAVATPPGVLPPPVERVTLTFPC
jgi:6-phosphogluconolactonase